MSIAMPATTLRPWVNCGMQCYNSLFCLHSPPRGGGRRDEVKVDAVESEFFGLSLFVRAISTMQWQAQWEYVCLVGICPQTGSRHEQKLAREREEKNEE